MNDPKAFDERKYKYYELLKPIPCLDAGAIFYYDPDDHIKGSIGAGCLKLCWTPKGSCYHNDVSSVCAGTIVFHELARRDKRWFKRVHRKEFNDYIEKYDKNSVLLERNEK